MKGTIKFFNQQKGFGFVHGEDGRDYYLNVRDVQGADLPNNKDQVEFKPREGQKGPRATNLQIISKGNANQHRGKDEREQCQHCGKLMMPRISFQNGSPYKSFCPFCGGLHKKFTDCFIATAVYGDVYAPEVVALRRFRDETLMPRKAGRTFVKYYYRYSPKVAEKLKNHPKISAVIRVPLSLLASRYR